MDINIFKDNSLVIVPNNLKNKLLKELDKLDKLVSIVFITEDEFIKKMTFDYDEETILFLMDKYSYDKDVCITILDNMKYVTNKNYSSNKLNNLVKLKEELLTNNLITIDNYYSSYIKNKNIYIYGYLYLSKFLEKILDGYKYQFIKLDNYNLNNNIVYEANTIEDEIDFVFHEIASLIDNGISPNNIKIVNTSSKYINVLNKMSKFYNIPIEDNGYSIYATDVVKDYLSLLKENNDFNYIIDNLRDKYKKEQELNIISMLVNLSNKYIGLNYNSIYYSIEDDLKHIKIKSDNINEISFGSLDRCLYSKDDYIFLIGFNQNELPRLYKDEDYISDREKIELGLENTSIKNKYEKEKVIDFINNTNNLIISYPLKHLSNTYYPSNLIEEENFKVKEIEFDNTNYSILMAKIKLTKYLDDFIKYGTINKDLNKYYSNYKIDYLTYDNKYKIISKDKIRNSLNNKLTLSYSSIDTYNKCHFRYYLDHILKIGKHEETFQIKVGNLFHYLLSLCFNNDFDLDKEWNKYLKDLDLSPKENILLIRLKEEFVLILDFIKRLHQETGLTELYTERRISIDKSRYNIKINFTGIIDKCMYKEKDGETLVSVIDYKTGNPDINLYGIAYGINMQLPIYWYLIKNDKIFSNPKFVGFYLEKILHSEIKRDKSREYEEIKQDNLKLVGYSTTDKTRLERFDTTYENSSYIKSMRVKQDGEFYNYTKTLEDDILELMVDYIDKIIDQDINSILESDFSIKPKQIGINLVGCLYCEYKDVCFRKNEDIDKVKEYSDLSFLGGDIDA